MLNQSGPNMTHSFAFNYKTAIVILLIWHLILVPHLFALDPHKRITQYDIKVYTTRDGLPMNSLKKVFQDSRGYIWIGTQEGLVRFDGVEFKTYNKSMYPGLKSNFILDIDEDADGNLWLATSGGGMSRFDGFKFTMYDTTDGLAHNIVNKIIVGKDGTIWAGTENGLSRFKNGQFINFTKDDGLCGNNIQAIFEDRNGNLFIGYSIPGLNMIINGSIITFNLAYRILSLCERYSGDIILGVETGVAYSFNAGMLYDLDPNRPFPKLRNFSCMRDIIEDHHGNIWFGSEKNAISRYSNGKFDNLMVENGLPTYNNRILSILEDHEGNLWFAGDAGLIQLKDNKFISYGPLEGSQSNSSHSVCVDQSGNICVGFRESGLSIFYQSTVRNWVFRGMLPEFEILSVIPAHDGGLWIGYTWYGLIRFFADGRIKNMRMLDGQATEFVSALFENSNHELWMGSMGFVSHFKNDQFHDYQFEIPSTRTEVTSVIHRKNNEIWFGTRGYGLYEIVNEKVTRQNIQDELLSDGITALFEDADSVLWIGSDNHGLYRYHNGTYTNYSVRDGLFCDRLFSILEDDSAKLWFSTNKGVFSVRKQQFEDYANQKISQITCQVYNQLDGMREAECNGRRQPSAWKARDGKLYFTSIAGVVCIDPNHYPVNHVKPPVYIEHFASSDSTYIWQEQSIRLKARERDLTFKYTALSFTIPERVKFKYQLIGYDKHWIEKTNRSANYTNLPKGNYTFQVIACNNDGLWNEEGASIQFTIPPFWWETWWAYGGYFGLGLSSMVWFFRRRYKQRYIRAQLKLKQEHAAKLEALDKARSRFFAGISHEFRTPLTLIEGPLQDFLCETKDQQQRSLIDMMLRNTRRLRRLVEQLLDLSQLQSDKLVLQARPVNLIPFLKNILAAFESYAKRENIELTFLGQDAILSYVDPEKMEKVFINLLSNAIKFTPSGGKVTLSITAPEEKSIKIRVTDTGRGIPAMVLPHIFDYFYRYRDESDAKESGSGIGLALTKELVKLQHGEIAVTSAEGVGTEFTVTLPLGKDHLKPEEIVSENIADCETEGRDFQEELSLTSDPIGEHGAEGTAHGIDRKRASAQKRSEKPSILLVEDNPDMRSYILSYLQSHYQMIEARDGQEGLDLALQEIPDLIISDVMMPRMDGFELCQRLKTNELTSHIPLILLTAKGTCEGRLKGLELGAIDYITKPFDKQELKLRIQNLLQFQRQLQEQLRKRISAIGTKLPEARVTSAEDKFFGSLQLAVGSHQFITSADDKFLNRVIRIAEQHITNPDFSPEKLAREVGLSRAHLNRKLKGLLNQRTNDFIRSLRLKRAALLLEKRAGTVSEIAFEVGFNHLAYFARSFKKQYGVAPSEYQAR